MSIEFSWGNDAVSLGFGGVQHVTSVMDFIFFDSEAINPAAQTSTSASYDGFLNGFATFLELEGTNLTYTADGSVTGGTITSATVYAATGSLTDNIMTFTGNVSGADVFAAVFAELTFQDITAVEDFLFGQNWIYNGTFVNDFLPENAVTDDGVDVNLMGNDDVKLLQGDDLFFSGDGNDTVKAASGNDELYGGEGNDKLFGSTGNDYIVGGNGNDLVSGQRDNDELFGGEGNDTLRGGSGEDFLVAGEGRDFNKAGFNDDVVFGNGGNDVISGNAGDDVLHGGSGDDLLRGGGGDDLLFGEAGDDRLKGGSGADEFLMDANNGNDVIIDWDANDVLIFADITVETEEEGEEPFNVTFFDSVDITFTTPEALIELYASVTADGVLFDFGSNGTMLLEGLTTTDGLEDQLALTSIYFADDAV